VSTFADSSALVKLYADEPDHEVIRNASTLVVSQLARVEVPAALWRKARTGELSPDDAGLLVADFEADYFGTPDSLPRFAAVAVAAAVLDAAAQLAAVHSLRAYDAVQLASARAAAAADPSCRTMAAFDLQLSVAAATEGFGLLPRRS
jgi:predicted nucleic acid-binding protein